MERRFLPALQCLTKRLKLLAVEHSLLLLFTKPARGL
jgi:hypothetical protein